MLPCVFERCVYADCRLPTCVSLPKREIFLLTKYAWPVVNGHKVAELRGWPCPFQEAEEFGIMESGNSAFGLGRMMGSRGLGSRV